MLSVKSEAELRTRFADIFENVAWAATRIVDRLPVDDLGKVIAELILTASDDEQLQLIRAHPPLAALTNVQSRLSEYSRREQSSAGLNVMGDREAEEMHRLNEQYAQRFGFPFVMAVQGASVDEILTMMQHRLGNSYHEEKAQALQEVLKIIRLRLGDRAP